MRLPILNFFLSAGNFVPSWPATLAYVIGDDRFRGLWNGPKVARLFNSAMRRHGSAVRDEILTLLPLAKRQPRLNEVGDREMAEFMTSHWPSEVGRREQSGDFDISCSRNGRNERGPAA